MSEAMTTQMDTVLTLLRRLSPREQLRVVAQVLPEVERELEIPASAADAAGLATEEAWERSLLTSGLLSEIPRPLAPSERDLPTPVTIPGRPLSEIIIAERR